MPAQPVMSGPTAPNRGGGPLFRPIVDLDSGAVLAIEVEAPTSDGTPGVQAVDSESAAQAERLARLARSATGEEALLPLVLPLPASAAARDTDVLRALEHDLRRAGRSPRDVTLMLEPGLRDVPHAALVRAVARVRELGFRCAFGTAGVPPDLLVEADPFLFTIDSDIIAGLPGDERKCAIVDGWARIGRGSGVFPMAAGVTTTAQLARLREAGIRLAHGPLFADDRWSPGSRVRPPPETPAATSAHAASAGPPVAEFMTPPLSMGAEATAEDVLEAFTNDIALNSVVLVDHRERPVAISDRTRFLLAVTGPYGHALHAKRPARRLADPPRTVARGMPAMAALRAAGADRDRVHDDLIAVNEFGQCTGIVHVGDLIRSLSTD